MLFVKIVVAIVESFVGVIEPAGIKATVVIAKCSKQERRVKKHCYWDSGSLGSLSDVMLNVSLFVKMKMFKKEKSRGDT